jgi:Sulfotransferase family
MTGHLVHIGAPKAGSHALRQWFTGHPELAYVEAGIAGYRDVFQIAREGATVRPGIRYRVTASEALSSPHPDVGRPFAYYDESRWTGTAAAQTAVCAALAGLFPTAHILLITRGFRSMILSGYSQYVRTGGDLDFSPFCTLLGNAAAAGEAVWDYNHLIRLYASAFGEAHLIVLPYELLRDDPEGFTRLLEARLGLGHFAPTRERLNVSLSPVEMYWYPRLTRAVAAMPGGHLLRRAYLRLANQHRLTVPIAVLQRLKAGSPVTLDLIPDELLSAFRGTADALRDNPLYTPYAREYLL